ncbi:hypothetical protein A2U01_0074600, partial [Trifolium medium]|nr:hypothetical protein [Trifolium medium]
GGGQRRTTGGRHGGAPTGAAANGDFPAVNGGLPVTVTVVGGGAPVTGVRPPSTTL